MISNKFPLFRAKRKTRSSLISVVIPTKNEEKNIRNCLESIKRQTYPQEKIEIIVVDNNSQDKTKEIAQKYTKKVFNLPDLSNLTRVKNFRGVQLNFGVKRSKGEIIFFPDADMTFDKKLIEEAVGFIVKSKFDALYIPEVVVGKGIFGKIRNFERSFYNETCIDAVRILKKNLFLGVGGFDENNISFGFDDWDFTKTIKKITPKVGITRNMIYHHEEDITIWRYINKKGKYVEKSDQYIQKWGRNNPDIQKQFGFWYRYFGVFIENGKWKKLLRHPILTGGMYFLRLAVGIVYLSQKFFKNEKTK
jgi:glycosyltransferase involved in cell wall biosynthesis